VTPRRLLPAALLAFVLGPAGAQAERELHWRALGVSARLDSDGRLQVVERHAMVFTGDWNGGERSFRVLPGQSLSFGGIRRIDPATGAARALSAGDLDQVDHFAFTNPTTLRWRSRLPSDPPFADTELVYEISYTLSGVLVKRGKTYLLDHNFALPDARKTIEALSVDVELDPAWVPPAGFARHRTVGPLAPGADYVVSAELSYRGAGAPSTVRTGTSRPVRVALAWALFAVVVLLAVAFSAREARLGRFRRMPVPEAIDAAWLTRDVFSLLPEEAGALWDDRVGAPEVTAVLARLTAEGKLESEASGKEMTLRLKAPLSSFQGYEKELIEALFFGHTETSTSAIKRHYARTGFDPASKIRAGLLEKLAGHADFGDRSSRPERWQTFVLFFAGAALLCVEPALGRVGWGSVIGRLVSMAIWWALGLTFAMLYQRRVEHLLVWSLSFLFVPALFVRGAFRGLSSGGLSPLPVVLGDFLLVVAIVNNLFNAAKTRDGPKKVARRQELVAARRFFERELKKKTPALKDSWFPWIAAFGLAPAVDRWSRAFPGAAVASTATGGSSAPSSSSGGSFAGESGGFTGGGGFSGGGGSSASWAVAAGALASGVAAPSSSGGGGGGGGGGGSSGGGGGGGW
jgi:uncharacterized membrane protein YgcG